MSTTSIALDEEIHLKIVQIQTKLRTTKKIKPRMIDLNNYLMSEAINNFSEDRFLSTYE